MNEVLCIKTRCFFKLLSNLINTLAYYKILLAMTDIYGCRQGKNRNYHLCFFIAGIHVILFIIFSFKLYTGSSLIVSIYYCNDILGGKKLSIAPDLIKTISLGLDILIQLGMCIVHNCSDNGYNSRSPALTYMDLVSRRVPAAVTGHCCYDGTDCHDSDDQNSAPCHYPDQDWCTY